MTTNLAKWASNNGQIIKSGLPNDRRAKFLPSVVGFAYDLLRYEYYLGNIGLKRQLPAFHLAMGVIHGLTNLGGGLLAHIIHGGHRV